MIEILAAAALTVAPPPGPPPAPPGIFLSDVTGENLLRMCERDARAFCRGYVLGIADSLNRQSVICRPIGSSTSQIESLVVGYIRARPQRWHIQASFLAQEALEASFPCPVISIIAKIGVA